MNDAVDRVITERQGLRDEFVSGFAVSAFAHLLLVGGGLLASLLFPREPPIRMMDGFAVPLPRGGGGTPNPEPPAPAPPRAEPAPPEPPRPREEPPPKVIKPPKEEPRKGLPELDARKSAKKEKAPPPQPARASLGTTGTSAGQQGLSIGPPGPGVPGGSDAFGDWYLASVQQRIWMLWSRQIKTGFNAEIGISFTILADGSVEDVRLIQPSGMALLDLAAQRAVLTAAPFGPLPKSYGTNRYTIQAVFRPTS